MTHSELLARVEGMSGPDREVDALIACWTQGWTMHEDSDPKANEKDYPLKTGTTGEARIRNNLRESDSQSASTPDSQTRNTFPQKLADLIRV